MRVRVEAPARLHLGMFDIGATLGRRFGGLGVAVSRPAVVVEVHRQPELTAEGPYAERALTFARRYLRAAGIEGGAHVRVEQAIPPHVGLGSGTKLGLAVARALASLYEQPADPFTLACLVGRGKRSAVGLWTFALGGFVVEGGRRLDSDAPAPMLARYEMPSEWRCVLAVPHGYSGLSGRAEEVAFEHLSPPAELAARIAHLVLMALLPALVERRLEEFGAALTRLQHLVGESFLPVQGGHFGNPRSAALIEAFLEWGAAGAGQSSWGPAVYALAAGDEDARRLAALAEEFLAGKGWVDVVTFDNRGARVTET